MKSEVKTLVTRSQNFGTSSSENNKKLDTAEKELSNCQPVLTQNYGKYFIQLPD
jgi:hypothetical protein